MILFNLLASSRYNEPNGFSVGDFFLIIGLLSLFASLFYVVPWMQKNASKKLETVASKIEGATFLPIQKTPMYERRHNEWTSVRFTWGGGFRAYHRGYPIAFYVRSVRFKHALRTKNRSSGTIFPVNYTIAVPLARPVPAYALISGTRLVISEKAAFREKESYRAGKMAGWGDARLAEWLLGSSLARDYIGRYKAEIEVLPSATRPVLSIMMPNYSGPKTPDEAQKMMDEAVSLARALDGASDEFLMSNPIATPDDFWSREASSYEGTRRPLQTSEPYSVVQSNGETAYEPFEYVGRLGRDVGIIMSSISGIAFSSIAFLFVAYSGPTVQMGSVVEAVPNFESSTCTLRVHVDEFLEGMSAQVTAPSCDEYSPGSRVEVILLEDGSVVLAEEEEEEEESSNKVDTFIKAFLLLSILGSLVAASVAAIRLRKTLLQRKKG